MLCNAGLQYFFFCLLLSLPTINIYHFVIIFLCVFLQMHLQYIADGKVTLEASGPLHGPHNNTAAEPGRALAPAVGAAAIVKDEGK